MYSIKKSFGSAAYLQRGRVSAEISECHSAAVAQKPSNNMRRRRGLRQLGANMQRILKKTIRALKL